MLQPSVSYPCEQMASFLTDVICAFVSDWQQCVPGTYIHTYIFFFIPNHVVISFRLLIIKAQYHRGCEYMSFFLICIKRKDISIIHQLGYLYPIFDYWLKVYRWSQWKHSLWTGWPLNSIQSISMRRSDIHSIIIFHLNRTFCLHIASILSTCTYIHLRCYMWTLNRRELNCCNVSVLVYRSGRLRPAASVVLPTNRCISDLFFTREPRFIRERAGKVVPRSQPPLT